MSLDVLAWVAFGLAAVPALLFFLNLSVYRPPGRQRRSGAEGISVLIPARNEEGNLRATLDSVLAGHDGEFEVIVLDDHSTDRTAELVAELARRDSRLRLEKAPSLPPGWCGKQHACQVLAGLARHPLLLFMDADVRLSPGALARLVGFMEERGADLASGVPRQELGTASERLLLPFIHFILLGYLPMHLMRWTGLAAFSAGCGQLFIARAVAYRRSGGHAMIRSSLHDGLMLPRLFRRAGLRTDLFDATDLAACRMYRSNGEAWRGILKNAVEGLAAPGAIVPMTVLLLGGQVLPFVLLGGAVSLSGAAQMLACAACLLAWLPRFAGAALFLQPRLSAVLHPLGVLALVAAQWLALARALAGKPAVWKGRAYSPPSSAPKPHNA